MMRLAPNFEKIREVAYLWGEGEVDTYPSRVFYLFIYYFIILIYVCFFRFIFFFFSKFFYRNCVFLWTLLYDRTMHSSVSMSRLIWIGPLHDPKDSLSFLSERQVSILRVLKHVQFYRSKNGRHQMTFIFPLPLLHANKHRNRLYIMNLKPYIYRLYFR